MKVHMLMTLLAACDPDAHVVIVAGANWPMEFRLAGITRRGECQQVPDERYDAAGSPHDVLLVEGAWTGYAHQRIWDLVRKA